MDNNNNKYRVEKNKYTAIPIKTLFHIAWMNISSKKLRSMLTIAGVVIGIGAIFFLLSFGIGLQQLVSDQVIGDESIKSIEVSTPNSRIIKLNEDALNKIRTYAHVEKVGQLYSFPSNISFKGGEVGSISYGVDTNYMDMTKFDLVEGRLLKNDDNGVAVISRGALKAMGIEDPKQAIDQTFTLNIPLNNVEAKEKPIKGDYKIVGVIDSGSGTEVYIPSYVFSQAGVEVFTQVKIIADDTNNISQLREQIHSTGFQTSSPIDTLDQINQIFKFFNSMLVGFGALGMIVASRRGVNAGFSLFSTPLWLILSLIGFMIVVGLLVVYFPARRAQRINPIDALRRE